MKFNPFSLGRPTNKCFDDALDFMSEVLKEHPLTIKRKDFLLVHSICRFSNDDEFSHAWVEIGKMAYHAQLDNDGNRAWLEVPKYFLYRTFKVKKTWKYTPHEAWQQNRIHKTYGPWLPELIALCKDKRKPEDPE